MPSVLRCRAPLHARETLLPRVAERAADFGFGFAFAFGLAVRDPTGFPAPAARGAGALPPGWLPTRGRVSGRLGPPAPTGSPQALHRPASGRCNSGGCGQHCPGPTLSLRLTRLPFVAELLPSDCAPMACAVVARTVTRPCDGSRHESDATAGLDAKVALSAS